MTGSVSAISMPFLEVSVHPTRAHLVEGLGPRRSDFALELAAATSRLQGLIAQPATATINPEPSARSTSAELLELALAKDQPMVWLAAPLATRAIEAYRDLMNTSV
jgi:hypothetical protein